MPMVPRGLFCVHRRRPYMYSTVCQRDRFNRALFFCPPAHLRVIQDHALVRACAHTHVRAHTHAPIEHHMNMVPTPSDEESGEEKKTLVDSDCCRVYSVLTHSLCRNRPNQGHASRVSRPETVRIPLRPQASRSWWASLVEWSQTYVAVSIISDINPLRLCDRRIHEASQPSALATDGLASKPSGKKGTEKPAPVLSISLLPPASFHCYIR